MKRKIAVISTGNGGQSMAAFLANEGYSVSLYARQQERVDMFLSNRFELSGKVSCTADIDLISCDMGEVVRDAYLIMVTTPAQYHAAVAETMAPFLRDGQVVVLNPGRTFGTCEFAQVLKGKGCEAKIILGETDTFIFTCRCTEVGKPIIYEIKKGVRVAGHNSKDTPYLRDLLAECFGDIQAANSVLQTGLTNIGMIFHPLPILMNITRIEAKEDFLFYIEGISPLVANVLERMDTERMAVANAIGVEVPSAKEWLQERYGSTGNTLYERIQSTQAYKNVLAPTDIDTRYIFEDIQTGCVPVSHLGKRLGVETEIIDAAVRWASILYNKDFDSLGRNASKIDLNDLIHSCA